MQEVQSQLRRLMKTSLRDLIWRDADESEDDSEPLTIAPQLETNQRRKRLRWELNEFHKKWKAQGKARKIPSWSRPTTAEQVSVTSYAEYKKGRLARDPTTEIIYHELIQEREQIRQQRNVAKIEAQIRDNLDGWVDTAEETDCLRAIQDIMDELNSIASVFKVQKTVTDAFCEDHMHPDNIHSSHRVYNLLVDRFEDIKSLISAAQRVNRSVRVSLGS
jgi:hypothetical protein